MATQPYAMNYQALFSALERIVVQPLIDACTEPWYNQTLCQVNDSVVRLGVVQGEFHRHKHDREDEFFFVLQGLFRIELDDQVVELKPGQGFTVPRGVPHRPTAPVRTAVLMIEAASVNAVGDDAEPEPVDGE